MNKQKREDGFDILRQRNDPAGLRMSKRIKAAVENGANKENLQVLPEIRQRKSTLREVANSNRRNMAIRRVLHLKNNNRTEMFTKYPISEHVVKSNLYDEENWIEQQETLFTSILNEIFESQNANPSTWDEGISESLRATAFEYYQSEQFQQIVRRLRTVLNLSSTTLIRCKALKTKRLQVIDQLQYFRDIGLRSAIKQLLYGSYTYSWLALGIQLVTGRTYASWLQKNQVSLFIYIDNVSERC